MKTLDADERRALARALNWFDITDELPDRRTIELVLASKRYQEFVLYERLRSCARSIAFDIETGWLNRLSPRFARNVADVFRRMASP